MTHIKINDINGRAKLTEEDLDRITGGENLTHKVRTGFSSNHPSGANFLLCDGSAETITSNFGVEVQGKVTGC